MVLDMESDNGAPHSGGGAGLFVLNCVSEIKSNCIVGKILIWRRIIL